MRRWFRVGGDWLFRLRLRRGLGFHGTAIFSVQHTEMGSLILLRPEVQEWLGEYAGGPWRVVEPRYVQSMGALTPRRVAFARNTDAVLFRISFPEATPTFR